MDKKETVRLEMRNLKQAELRDWRTEEERLRIIWRENEKIEINEKQRLATLKRLKRGDDNNLEWNLRLEKVFFASKQLRVGHGDRRRKKSMTEKWCSYQTAQFGHGDGGRKKTKTGEDGSYPTVHVSPDKSVVDVGMVLSLKPIQKSWQLCLP